jgi:hypothetical protein
MLKQALTRTILGQDFDMHDYLASR